MTWVAGIMCLAFAIGLTAALIHIIYEEIIRRK